jgi:hypothetical protein
MENATEKISLFQGMLRLVPSEFERKLSLSNQKILTKNGWSEEAKRRGIFIDLSQVRWIELSTAGQLVLLIENALDNELKITIAFPLNKLSSRELSHLEKIKKTQPSEYDNKKKLFNKLKDARIAAMQYLKNIQFEKAINIIKNAETIIKIYDYDAEERNKIVHESILYEISKTKDKQTSYADEDYSRYKLLVPLTWINCYEERNELKNFEDLFERIISQPEKGLEKLDAEAIKNVIISELIKNVREHSGKKYGLIGAVLQPTEILVKQESDNPTDFNPVEKEYVLYIYKKNNFYVSIFFGDSGKGIVGVLKESYKNKFNIQSPGSEDIIKWSFDKWSTSKSSKSEEKIRGTKGLYRIHRIINKYDGIITCRTTDKFVAFQKGGKAEPTWIKHQKIKEDTDYCCFPGTIMKMYFTPYKELSRINTSFFTQSDHNKKSNWISKSLIITDQKPQDTFSGELSIEKIFTNNSDNLLLIINNTLSTNPFSEADLIDHIKYLCLARHPNGIIIYFSSYNWNILIGALDSLNQMIYDKKFGTIEESSEPDKEDMYDPILIMGPNTQYSWVGGEKIIIEVLEELYKVENGQKKLIEIDSFKKLNEEEKTKIFQFVYNEPELVSLSGEQELRINFKNLSEHFSHILERDINGFMTKTPKTKEIITLTPNLRFVDKWIPITDITKDNLIGYAFAIFLKFPCDNIDRSNNRLIIFIDHDESKELATQFARLIGVEKDNIINLIDEIDGRLPRRNIIFEENDNVIILTTIISSTETIRRSTIYVLRDLARPLVILGLVNQSGEDQLRIWDKDIKIITLAKYSINKDDYLDISKPIDDKKINYTNPITFKVEKYDKDDESESKNGEILKLIEKSKSLHFNHIGKTNGRHFTFFLNPKSLLSDVELCDEIVVKKFEEAIAGWSDLDKINDFELWKPKSETLGNDLLDYIAQKLVKNKFGMNKKTEILEIRRASRFGEWILLDDFQGKESRSKNIVIIDWGCMTGNTIQQMINLAIKQEQGIEKILICILLSQLSKTDAVFYKNLNEVKTTKLQYDKTTKKENEANLFPETESESNSKLKLVELKADITIKFIYEFPLKYYESFNCPVCEHRKVLSDFEKEGQYIRDFAFKRRKLLKIKDKNIADGVIPPQDFSSYYTENISEIDSALIMKMFKLKVLLQEAVDLTQKRQEIQDFIENIDKNFDKYQSDPNSKLYAFLYFVSVENIWLQKPPLVFDKLRKRICEIALKIAIWTIDDMKGVFDGNINLVIRYKYAAIDVLRSSKKRLFCKNIYEIFISSKKDNLYYDDLIQNLFFHTFTILLKRYLVSKEYYTFISDGMINILQLPDLDNKIKFIVQSLKNYALIKSKETSLTGKSKLDIFKSLKNEINTYLGNSQHSELHDTFRRMRIEEIVPSINSIKEKIANPNDLLTNKVKIETIDEIKEDRTIIENWARGLNEKWWIIYRFLNSIINLHLDKLSDLHKSLIFRDSLFSTYFPSISRAKNYSENNKLGEIINYLSERPLDILKYENEYKNEYDNLLWGLFAARKFGHEHNSLIINIVENIPTNVTTCIREYIEPIKRKFKTINFDYDKEYYIFYPQLSFNFLLDLIFQNIAKHAKIQNKTEECEVTIITKKIEESIIIEFSNTYNKRDGENNINTKGGLAQIIDDLSLYDGECKPDFRGDAKINLKFKNFGE